MGESELLAQRCGTIKRRCELSLRLDVGDEPHKVRKEKAGQLLDGGEWGD